MDRKGLIEAVRNARRERNWVALLTSLAELERLEPTSPDWPEQAAEAHRLMHDTPGLVLALNRAARRFAAQGQGLKAVVCLKQALAANPDHQESKAALGHLMRANAAPPPAQAPVKKVLGIPAQGSLALIPLLRHNQEKSPPPAPKPPPPSMTELMKATESAKRPSMAPVTDALSAILGVTGLQIPDATTAVEFELELPPSDEDRPRAPRDLPDEAPPKILEDPRLAHLPDESLTPALELPLFGSLSPEGLRRLIGSARMVTLPKGEVLFRQGDLGEALYVIASGKVQVVAEEPSGESLLAELGDGDFFGEIALFADRPRQATIRASADAKLLEIHRRSVFEIARFEPGLIHVLFQFFRERVVSLLIKSHPLFLRFHEEDLDDLVRRFLIYDVDAGTVLIQQGHPSPALILHVAGQLAVTRTEPDGLVRRVATLPPGHVSGEISLIDGRPATATVVAEKKSVILAMSREAFDEAIHTHPELYNYVVEVGRARLRQLEALTMTRVGLI